MSFYFKMIQSLMVFLASSQAIISTFFNVSIALMLMSGKISYRCSHQIYFTCHIFSTPHPYIYFYHIALPRAASTSSHTPDPFTPSIKTRFALLSIWVYKSHSLRFYSVFFNAANISLRKSAWSVYHKNLPFSFNSLPIISTTLSRCKAHALQ